MALSLPSIRAALAAKVKAGVARSINAYAYDPGSPALPCIIVRDADDPERYPYHETMGTATTGKVSWTYDLEVMVPLSGSVETGQQIMDEFRSVGNGMTNSIADAVEATTQTLGGLIENMFCAGSSIPLTYQPENGDPAYISSLFTIHMTANRN